MAPSVRDLPPLDKETLGLKSVVSALQRSSIN